MNARLPIAPRWLRYAGVAGCALVILSASLAEPDDGVPRTLFGVGFTVYLHLLAYAGLAGAVGYARLATDPRTLLVAVVVATLYGAAIELLQGTVPYRTMSGLDAAINAAGAVAGGLSWRLVAPLFGAEGNRPGASGEGDERLGSHE